MYYQFTPGVERALLAAAGWSSTDSGAIEPPELLLGLLAEPECRAALLLASFGIDERGVHDRWRELKLCAEEGRKDRSEHYSPDVLHSLAAAEDRLFEYPRPLVLATEHVLLGLAAADHEVARWLGEHGVNVDRLEAEVHRLAGHQIGPLPLEFEERTSAGPQTVSGDGREILSRLPPSPPVAPPPQVPPPAIAGEQAPVLRILDAAANRAGEGLRVVEDYLRFVLDDRYLTEMCKAIRHELTDALIRLPADQRHAARDVSGDVGSNLKTEAELRRAAAADVALAGFKRAEQALRSLEEYSKLRDPLLATTFERLRYRVYVLERAADTTHQSLKRLANVRLYVLVDGRGSLDEFSQLIESLLGALVHAIQFRDKSLSDQELLERARRLRELAADTLTLTFVNDRPDLALLAGVDGVHLGQTDMSVKDARRVLGASPLVGVSTHSLDEARRAVADGASYIGVGPTFPSSTKEFQRFTGVELLGEVQAELRLPALAVGGITLDNLDDVLATGVKRVAVQGAIVGAADPAAAARAFLERLD